jgi:DNA-binding transcriptional LysR family regulator
VIKRQEVQIEQARRRLRLRDLETLVTVVRAGGMRKAASELNLSQPAVSKAVAELEDTVGLKLLERGRRGVVPTAFGAALARRAEGLIDGVRGALRELDELADPEAGEVRVGSMETLHAGVVSATATAMLSQHPRVRLIFESGQSPDLIQHFLMGRLVDFVVARPYSPTLPPEIDAEHLFTDRLLVMVGQNHPAARRRKIGLVDLQQEHWILSRNEVLPDSPIAQTLREQGLELPSQIIISGGLAMRFALLATGNFVTCVPHSLMPFLPQPSALRVLPIRLPTWRTATMILTLRGRIPSPATQLFLAKLREQAQPLIES